MEIPALCHRFSVPEVGDVPCEVGVTNLRLVSNNHHNDEHSENSDPSGEVIFNSPLPPYERQWRHPSEVAEQVQLSTPEPHLPSRTLRSVVSCAAVTSFAVSLVLLWVAGMGMAGVGKISLAGTPFITATILLWLIALAVSWFMIRPALNDPSDDTRKIMAAGIGITHLILVVSLYLMIFKPGGYEFT